MNKRIFAKHTVIKSLKDFKNSIENNTKFFNTSREIYLDQIIKGEIGDIIKSTEIIEREKQRIKKAKKNITILLSIMTEKGSKECKLILRKAYKNNLSNQLQKIKSKSKR